jgi:hypothetical protein
VLRLSSIKELSCRARWRKVFKRISSIKEEEASDGVGVKEVTQVKQKELANAYFLTALET